MRALFLISLSLLSFKVMAATTCEGVSRAPAVLEIEDNFRAISSKVDNIQDDLFSAIEACDKGDIKKAIRNDADIQATNADGKTPLEFAKQVGCEKGEEILSSRIKEASIDLYEAIDPQEGNCDADAIANAIKKGADVNATNDLYNGQIERMTVLTYATKKNCIEAVKQLAPNPRIKIDDDRTANFNTALMIAARWNRHEIAQILVDNKANVNAGSTFERSALIIAGANVATDVARIILSKPDVDLNVNPTIGRNALGVALFMGANDIAEMIINHDPAIKPMTAETIRRAKKWAKTDEMRARLDQYLEDHPQK